MILLPGWVTKIDEISNGVFTVLLTSNGGRRAEATASFDDAIERAISLAFDIEKTYSVNWSKFLFDFCTLTINNPGGLKCEYNGGSSAVWSIESTDHRIIYVKQADRFVHQVKQSDRWFDLNSLSKDQLSYYAIKLILKTLR